MSDEPQATSKRATEEEERDELFGLPDISVLLGDELEAPSEEAPAPGDMVGPYTLRRELGRGGMGVVYEATRGEGEIELRVALKLLRAELCSAELRPLLEREAAALSHLSHSNIARLLDWRMASDGVNYFAMEYVEGETIDRYCEREALGLHARLRLCLQLCDAVAHAHRHMIAHLDIKPGNVMVDAQGELRLLDFGVARTLGETAGPEPSRGYSPHYASPEQRRGEAPTALCDVYALGVMLKELTEKASESTPVELQAILAHAVAEETAERYASVDELAADLRRCLARRPPLACAVSTRRRLTLFCRRNWRSMAFAGLALIGLIGGLWAWRLQTLERIEQARAEHMKNSLRQLSDTLLFPLEEQMRSLPGSTPARLLAVQTGLRFLEELSSEASHDAELRVEVARAYMKLGDIQGDPSVANLGDTPGAQKSYARVRELISGLNLPMAHELLGQVDTHEGDLIYYAGDSAAALRLYHEAAAQLAPLEQRAPKDLRVAQSYSLALLDIGDLQMANGENAAARQSFDKALELAERVLAANPQNVEAQRDAARLRSRHGDLAWAAGDWRGALASYRASFKVYEDLIRAHPDNARAQHSWIAGGNNVAIADEKLGDNNEALDLYTRILALERKTFDLDETNLLALRNLYVGYSNQARVLLHMERLPEAATTIANELAFAQKEMRAKPQDATAIDDYTGALTDQAKLAARRKHMPEAIQSTQKALALLRELMRHDPKTATAAEIVEAELQLGGYQIAAGQRAALSRTIADARSMLDKLDRNDAEQRSLFKSVDDLAARANGGAENN